MINDPHLNSTQTPLQPLPDAGEMVAKPTAAKTQQIEAIRLTIEHYVVTIIPFEENERGYMHRLDTVLAFQEMTQAGSDADAREARATLHALVDTLRAKATVEPIPGTPAERSTLPTLGSLLFGTDGLTKDEFVDLVKMVCTGLGEKKTSSS